MAGELAEAAVDGSLAVGAPDGMANFDRLGQPHDAPHEKAGSRGLRGGPEGGMQRGPAGGFLSAGADFEKREFEVVHGGLQQGSCR